MKNLTGKIAFVTGGSRGIGAAIAKRLANEGAIVVLTYSSSPEKADEVVREIIQAGGAATAVKANGLNADEVTGAVEATITKYGQIDILVNNAGILG